MISNCAIAHKTAASKRRRECVPDVIHWSQEIFVSSLFLLKITGWRLAKSKEEPVEFTSLCLYELFLTNCYRQNKLEISLHDLTTIAGLTSRNPLVRSNSNGSVEKTQKYTFLKAVKILWKNGERAFYFDPILRAYINREISDKKI